MTTPSPVHLNSPKLSSLGTPRAPVFHQPSLLHSKSDDSLVEDDLVPDQSSPETSRLADDIGSLTSMDIRSDPILSSLARKQAQTPTNPPVAFKAKPAPSNLRQEGVGPRMTKSAALRQGLQWEGNTIAAPGKSAKTVSSGEDGPGARERKEVDFANVPGHKREGLGIAVASLSTPSIAPRETKASKLRTGGAVTTPAEKRDMAAAAAAAKAKERAENLKKRASIALPASLAAPQIAPRANRSSQLRTAGPVSPPSDTSRPSQALKATISATNIRKEAAEGPRVKAPYEEKVNRRASVAGVKSLGAPSIMPRANKSSMLRAPGAPGPVNVSSVPPTRKPSRPSTSNGNAPAFGSAPSSRTTGRPSTSAGQSVGPRPTKASLLRAGFGVAKVPMK